MSNNLNFRYQVTRTVVLSSSEKTADNIKHAKVNNQNKQISKETTEIE